MNWALVGRPARVKSRVPSAMLARAALDLTRVCFGLATLFDFGDFFLVFMISVPPRTGVTIRGSIREVNLPKVLFLVGTECLFRFDLALQDVLTSRVNACPDDGRSRLRHRKIDACDFKGRVTQVRLNVAERHTALMPIGGCCLAPFVQTELAAAQGAVFASLLPVHAIAANQPGAMSYLLEYAEKVSLNSALRTWEQQRGIRVRFNPGLQHLQ